MAYSDVALLANDYDFTQRVTAAVATEQNANPMGWVQEHYWQVAGSPGFGDAYASAIAGNVERPGNDPAVISDAQILSAVQAIMAEEITPADVAGNGGQTVHA